MFSTFVLKPVCLLCGLPFRSTSFYRSYSKASKLFQGKEFTLKKGAETSGSARPTAQQIQKLLKRGYPERFRITAALGMLAVSTGIMVSFPFFIGRIIDTILSSSKDKEKARSSLRKTTGVLFGVFVIGGLANATRVYLMRVSSQRIVKKIRDDVYRSIIAQEVAFFDANRTGELVNRLSADTALVGSSLTLSLSDGIRSAATAVGGVSMMLYVSPPLAGVALTVVPTVALAAALSGKYLKNIARDVQDALAMATQLAEERISSIRTVRTFGNEEREVDSFLKETQRVLGMQLTEAKLRAIFFGSVTMSMNMIILLVLYRGGLMMSDGVISAGDLSSFLIYALYVGVSVQGISSFYSDLMKALGASQRLWQLIDRQPLIPLKLESNKVTRDSFSLAGDIVFDRICFSYRRGESQSHPNLFDNLSLTVPHGSTLAVVGPSGSGKSTLAHVLLRFYDLQSGQILIDGVDIKDLDPTLLRQQIGTVAQEPVLFAGTVRDNIVYGLRCEEKVTDEIIHQAAKTANAHDFILRLPSGYDTLIGERGILLSGGQRQRVAIARAVIRNPSILLLDEATSALDSESEFLVKDALEKVSQGRTVITIAHRLSTIRSAHKIAVLASGRIQELGSYSELIQLNGLFKQLIEKQTI